tara:strand:- start:236 stop:853 length:618 start_codon:yes stop_codon:yes gene_type:complete
MALPAKTGTCSICKKKGPTDWHHIISQHHARRTGRSDLLDNPDNVVELCRDCHNQTTASMVRKRLTKQKGPLKIRNNKSVTRPKKTVKRSTDPEALKSFKRNLSNFKKSKAALKRRFVWRGSGGQTGKGLQNRINQSLQLKGMSIEELYPPDHWLHNPKIYDARKCAIFEGSGWKWTKDKGADKSGRRQPDPNYQPPPRKGYKLS